MSRPLQLEICPKETYPVERSIDDKPSETLVIRDMQHMAQYVYDFYLDKVNLLKDQYKEKKLWAAPGEAVVQEGAEGIVSQHPAVDYDSDNNIENDEEVELLKAKKKKKDEPFVVTDIQNEIEEMETQ